MVLYNFKTIVVVPSAKDFIDVILSKTQRKTPTVVHKGWQISRIRSFYMRKVKYTQQNYEEKLAQILEDFPRLDSIHPFYADLINVLYSRDHYKLALGQINTAKNLIENISKDYLKMLKFGDSLYRCKELKRAALGRMCTVMKKMGPSLGYLEEVRQHLSRLPSIDPNTRTLMITGYPNVGKSSFINKVSRADVDVQPYAFTTKSLFIGHTDYKFMRWQVIDTPGILDHALEDRNTIEMQAVTALAHLHSTVLYFIDISETCGYTIKQQVSLYHSIKPLFANKPLLVVCNKIDLKKWADVPEDDKELINSVISDRNTQMIQMSNATEHGISTVKNTACDMLLHSRVERKLKSKRINDVINRIHVTRPVKRDDKLREVHIPTSVTTEKAKLAEGLEKQPRRLARDIEEENGGAGIFTFDHRAQFKLPEDWKYDVIPEIIDGKNIADFVDPDIEAKLAALEREEDAAVSAYEAQAEMEDSEDELDEHKQSLVDKIRNKRKLIIAKRIAARTNNKPILPRTAKRKEAVDAEKGMQEMGINTSKFSDKVRGRARVREEVRTTLRKKRDREEMEADGDEAMGLEGEEASRALSRARSKSKARDASRAPRDAESYANEKQKSEAAKRAKKVQKKGNQNARAGEGDHRIWNDMPRHLFSGKRGIGKTDRR